MVVVTTSPSLTRCGLVALVGRPNVGKSTLLNALLGQKVSITSCKPQTTRHRITGVLTQEATQFVFVDTPGFQTHYQAGLNRHLNRTVHSVLADVDVILCLLEAGRLLSDDQKVLATLAQANPSSLSRPAKPVFLIANKLDKVSDRTRLLPWLQQMQARFEFAEVLPICSHHKADQKRLLQVLKAYMPEQEWFYDESTLTDRDERFLATELIREKLFRLTGDELPYTSTVVLERFTEELYLRRIQASIVVERESHKGMIIGQGGAKLKRIGSEARQELETLLGGKVYLELWVKVRSGWVDDEARLKAFGYA